MRYADEALLEALRGAWPRLMVRSFTVSSAGDGSYAFLARGSREALIEAGLVVAEDIDTLPACGERLLYRGALFRISRTSKGYTVRIRTDYPADRAISPDPVEDAVTRALAPAVWKVPTPSASK